jgi:hypothetical protein
MAKHKRKRKLAIWRASQRQLAARKRARAAAAAVRDAQRVDARRFAFSILTNGKGFQSVAELFLWFNIHPPWRSSVYEAQHAFFEPIHKQARDECKYWADRMSRNTVIAFDGAWSHRRRAKECIVTIIDCKQKKIVDYEILTKSKCGGPGNWGGSPYGMEVEALKRLIPRWMNDDRVSGVVHDNDARATKAMSDLGWKPTEMFDPNHVCKQFETKWNNCRTTHLRGIHAPLLAWFRHVIQGDFTAEQRAEMWQNSLEHFKGNHAKCPREHPKSFHAHLIKGPEAAAELQHVLNQTMFLDLRRT